MRDRVLDLRRVPAHELRPHPENWRTHPARQQRILSDLLDEVGFADAVLARETEDGGLQIIDGHLRAEVSGEEEIPVLVLDVDEDEARRLLLSLDPLAALAETAREQLAELITRTSPGSVGMAELMAFISPVALERFQDELPSRPAKPKTRPGALWLLGDSAVLCADSSDETAVGTALERLGAPVSAVMTDPPYGVSYRRKIAGDELRGAGLRALVSGALSALGELAPGAPAYVFHADSQREPMVQALEDAGFRIRQTLIWVKNAFVLGRADYHMAHESILYASKPGKRPWYGARRASSLLRDAGAPEDLSREALIELVREMQSARTSVQRADKPAASPDHPTTKPVPLLARLVLNSTARGDLIADPFAGSGSTLIAAAQLGRRCLAVELDPGYVDVICHRWQEITGCRPASA